MRKIKLFFKYLLLFLIKPIKTIASVDVSDRFINYLTKNAWLRIVIALVVSAFFFYLIYYTNIL